jgi:hypothetical protein
MAKIERKITENEASIMDFLGQRSGRIQEKRQSSIGKNDRKNNAISSQKFGGQLLLVSENTITNTKVVERKICQKMVLTKKRRISTLHWWKFRGKFKHYFRFGKFQNRKILPFSKKNSTTTILKF